MASVCTRLLFFLYFYLFITSVVCEEESLQTFKIEGKVSVLQSSAKNKHPVPLKSAEWMSETTVLVDGGNYRGFLKQDGTFVVSSVPSGSYIVEVASPNYQFDMVRVDITKGGKIRARKVNFMQQNTVQLSAYPLRFTTTNQAPFFEVREQWRARDFLFNPMVLMMVVPLLFVVVMPKLVSMVDPEAQKEMESQMSALQNPQQQVPDLSEMVTNMFSGGDAKKKKSVQAGGVKKAGKRR